MKQPCYQACARKTDKVTFTTRSDPIVFAIVFNAEEQKTHRFEPRWKRMISWREGLELERRVGVGEKSWRKELELENGIVFFLVGENRVTTTLQLQLMTPTNRS